MDAIQALSSKANPAAAVANEDDSANAAGAFAALLARVGAAVKAIDTTSALDSKLVRNEEPAKARTNDRDAAKMRDDKDEAPAKAKKTNDDKDTDETKATSNDDTAEDTADAAQTPEGQAAAQVAATVAIEVPLVTSEIVAPVLIAQQVQAAADTGAAQNTAVETVAAAADTAAIETETAVVDPNAGQKTVAVEAPAAVQKTAEASGPVVKQAAAETAGPVKAKVAETAVTNTPTATVENKTAQTNETAQVNTTTQRSAAAQAQSQDLSQKVGPETKAQVQVTVTNHAGAQTAQVNSVYDIYAGYNGGQMSTANGQVGVSDAGNALVGSKNPAEAVQAQVASPASPALAPQPQTQASQQGTSSSAARADFAVPSATQSGGNHSSASFGESGFGSANTSSNQTNGTTASAQTTATESPQRTAQQIIDQIKVNITRAAKAGLDKVTIQLKPIELGRIDVQLEMSEDHKVRVTVTADNKDTLALLQNDSRTLERTLNDAGLRTDANNLHFSLRGDSDAQHAADGKNGGKNAKADNAGATTEEDDIAMTYDYIAAARARGGVDTFA